jgi:hypothetical protein
MIREARQLFASLLQPIWDSGLDVLVQSVLAVAITLFSVFVMPRRLWRLHGVRRPEDVKLLVSQRVPERMRSHALPVVGMGQLQAVGALAPSLVRSYGWRWRGPLSIRPGLPKLEARDLAENLILVGGASHNDVTRRFLEKSVDILGVEQRINPHVSGDCLSVRDVNGDWKSFEGRPLDGTIGEITETFALIARMPNPWDERGRTQCVLLAGVHTYGTGAAASYFVRQWWKPAWRGRSGVRAILHVTVEDGHPVRSRVIDFQRLPLTPTAGRRSR